MTEGERIDHLNHAADLITEIDGELEQRQNPKSGFTASFSGAGFREPLRSGIRFFLAGI